jgi:hypothetical protein
MFQRPAPGEGDGCLGVLRRAPPDRLIPGPDAREGALQDAPPLGADRRPGPMLQGTQGHPSQGAQGAQARHVEAAVRQGIRDRLKGQSAHPGTGAGQGLGYRLALAVREDQGPLIEGQLIDEALDVVPVEAQQDVEAVPHARHRPGAEAHHGGGLAAADLGARGACQKPVVARPGDRGEQDQAGGDRTAAAGAGDRDAGTSGVGLRVLHGSPANLSCERTMPRS